jgi:hypothetical protein
MSTSRDRFLSRHGSSQIDATMPSATKSLLSRVSTASRSCPVISNGAIAVAGFWSHASWSVVFVRS